MKTTKWHDFPSKPHGAEELDDRNRKAAEALAHFNSTRKRLTQFEHEWVMARIDAIIDAKPGTPEGDELDRLVALALDHEAKTAFTVPIEEVRADLKREGIDTTSLKKFVHEKLAELRKSKASRCNPDESEWHGSTGTWIKQAK